MKNHFKINTMELCPFGRGRLKLDPKKLTIKEKEWLGYQLVHNRLTSLQL